jgi:hypothetical protein
MAVKKKMSEKKNVFFCFFVFFICAAQKIVHKCVHDLPYYKKQGRLSFKIALLKTRGFLDS